MNGKKRVKIYGMLRWSFKELNTILLTCPKCKRTLKVDRQPFDPIEATEMWITCPNHKSEPAFDNAVYYDKNHNQITELNNSTEKAN